MTRWGKQINDGQEEPGESELCYRPRSDRSSSNISIDHAHALIKENGRITINELAESLGVSAGCAVKIVDFLE